MNVKAQRRFLLICRIVGISLIVAALSVFLYWHISSYVYSKKLLNYINAFEKIVPETQNAILEDKKSYSMPMANIDNHDFIGIIEFESNGRVFPIGAYWDSVRTFPCRYYGSVYDGSIIIGANNQKGQIDFVKNICAYDKIYFIDTLGNRYIYNVTDIKYSKNINNDVLDKGEHDFTLFVRNIYGFEYVIIFCDMNM